MKGRNDAAIRKAVERILVIAVLALLAFLLIPAFHTHERPSSVTEARLMINNFETAVDNFHADTGRYPSGTNALLQLMSASPGVTNWHGPYLQELRKDPWGQDYVYVPHGKYPISGRPYNIFSPGPPGKDAPIGNWQFHNRQPEGTNY